MTYTTVHKDYPADTFGDAVADVFRDREIFDVQRLDTSSPFEGYGTAKGSPIGYAIDSWEWDQVEHRLRVQFR